MEIIKQSIYPNEILIVDSSDNNETELFFKTENFRNTKYFKVEEKDRGLTKQRNFGLRRINKKMILFHF